MGRPKKSGYPTIYFEDLVRDVARRTGMNKYEADILVRQVFDAIKSYLFNGIEVNVPHFGRFGLADVKAKRSRLPTVQSYIPAHVKPVLRWVKPIRDMLKRNGVPTKSDSEKDDKENEK